MGCRCGEKSCQVMQRNMDLLQGFRCRKTATFQHYLATVEPVHHFRRGGRGLKYGLGSG